MGLRQPVLDRFGGSKALSPRHFSAVVAVVAAITAGFTAPLVARVNEPRTVSVVSTPTTVAPNTASETAAPVTTETVPATIPVVTTTAAPVLEAEGFTVSRDVGPSWSPRTISACRCRLALPWAVSSEQDVALASGATAHVVLSEQRGAALSAAVWTVNGTEVDPADIIGALSTGSTATTAADGNATRVILRSASSTARAQVTPTATGAVVLLVASTTNDPVAEFNRLVASYQPA